MSDSDNLNSNDEDDPLAIDDSSQPSFPGSDDEEEDGFFEPVFSGSDYNTESDISDSDVDEPPVKKVKRSPPTKSKRAYQWQKTPHTPKEVANQSPSVAVKEEHVSLDPLEIFNKYFDEPFIRLIVKLTNNAAAKEGKQLELTEAELKAYIGMLIIMGFHKLPHFKDYWHTDINLTVPRITDIMPLHRVKDIRKYLSFSADDIKNQLETDIGMVRPLVDHLNEKFRQIRQLGHPLTIDESTVRPRNLKEQFRKSREQNFFVLGLCCAKTGYIFRVNVRPSGDVGSSSNVRNLLLPFEGSGCSVYIARKRSDFPLVEELHDQKIFACCQLAHNDTNIPTELRNKRLKSSRGRFLQSGDFSITKWRDTRKHYAYILSTLHNPADKTSVSSKDKEFDCPQVVVDYCNFVQGVRMFDHQRLTYSTSWKSYSWKKRLFYFMLDATLVNSHLVYKSSWDFSTRKESGCPLTPVQFRSELANGLIGGYVGRKRANCLKPAHLELMKKNSKRSSSVKNSTRLQNVGNHLPIKCTLRRCAYCSVKGKQKRSTVACTDCKVALCIPCFAPFHTD